MDNKYLYIPIALKGLMIGKNSGKFADKFYDFSKIKATSKPDEVLAKFNTEAKLDSGVHLHWSLPDAYTHGVQNDQTDMLEFYHVPNRFIITRIWTDDKTLKSKSFIIESNVLSEKSEANLKNIGSPTRLSNIEEEIPYRYLGRAYDIEDKSIGEPKAYELKLKPIEECDYFYSAYYPSCKNVFGFYDDLKDENGKQLKNVKISYCVCGWYDIENFDPVYSINNFSVLQEKFNWSCKSSLSGKHMSICHGMLLDLNWKNVDEDYTGNFFKDLTKPKLSVGNTSKEAISALCKNNQNDSVSERLMNYFMIGNHDIFENSKSLDEAEKSIHFDRFNKITPEDKVSLKENENNPYIEKNGLDYIDIDEINSNNKKLFELRKKITDKKQYCYEQWVRYMELLRNKKTTSLRKIERNILDIVEEIEELKEEYKKCKTSINVLYEILQKTNGDDVNLTSETGQRFYAPNDIVLLFTNIERDYSHGYDGINSENGALLKVRDKTITKLTVNEKTTIENLGIGGEIEGYKKAFPKDAVKAVILETVLLSPAFSKFLSKNFMGGGFQKELEALQSTVTLPVLNKDYSSLDVSLAAGYDADYPDLIGVRYYKQPWHPLYLYWEADYYPDKNSFSYSEEMFKRWKFNMDDYTLVSDEGWGEIKKLKGHTIITPHLSNSLSNEAEKLFSNNFGVSDVSVLSQELSGMNQLFLLNDIRISLPVKSTAGYNPTLSDYVAEALGAYRPDTCIFDELFIPVRAGKMKFTNISVIDSFGQVLDIDLTKIEKSSNLKSNACQDIILPPRILQPARLLHEWRSDSNNGSPILGWFVPNMSNLSAEIFDESGTYIGSLENIYDAANPIVFRTAPDKGGKAAEIPENINEDLKAFLNGILNAGFTPKDNVLQSLIEIIDQSIWQINPITANEVNPMSLYFGRPLALAKAEMALQLDSPALHHKPLDPDNTKSRDVNLPEFKFPAFLGQQENHCDGVIAVFCDGDYKKTKLCVDTATAKSTKLDYFIKDNSVSLNISEFSETAKIRKVTYLFDPMGEININLGILPKKTIKLDSKIVERELNKLYYYIFTAPVLTEEHEFAIPHFNIEGKDMKWVYDLGIEADIQEVNENIAFSGNKTFAYEGWLKLIANGKEGRGRNER